MLCNKLTKLNITILLVAVVLIVCSAQVSQAEPMGTAFTYQGRLMDKNQPADGLYDFQFKVYDSNDPCTGTLLGSPIDINDLDVIDGHFVVELDFGGGIFDGNAVWLETSVVESPMGSDPCSLSPLLELTPTPYALYAETAPPGHSLDAADGYPTDVVYVDSFGDVGIGTTNPLSKLSVVGDGYFSGNVGIGTTSPTAKLSIQMLYSSHPILPPYNNPGLVIKGGDFNIGNQLEVQDHLGNTRFLVDNAGRVGIGTTSPDRTLEISGILRVAREADNAHGADFSYVVDEPVTGHDGLIIDSDTGGGWSDIHLRTIGTTKLFVESTGHVGIGTTNPDDLLHVSRDTSGSLGIRITNADVQGRDYALRVGGSDSAVGAGNFAIYDHNSSATRLVVDSTGNVGIGTESPQAKLHIGGTAGVDGIKFPDDTLQTTAGGGSTSVPIGTVIDWWRPNDTFAVPDGYQICDGSVVNDAQSPFNGQTLPDLRTNFVRGATSVDNIGVVGGSSTHTHTISGTTASKTVTLDEEEGPNLLASLGPHFEAATSSHSHTTNSHSHTTGSLANSSESTLPRYVTLLKIMRIR